MNDDFLGHELSEVTACEDKLMFLLAEAAECHVGDCIRLWAVFVLCLCSFVERLLGNSEIFSKVGDAAKHCIKHQECIRQTTA